MLYATTHGRSAFTSKPGAADLRRTFRYYDKSLPTHTHDQDTLKLLSTLGSAMTGTSTFAAPLNSRLAPVFTYIGQFLDHDLSAGTDFDPLVDDRTERIRQSNAPIDLTPIHRDDAEDNVVNDNTARLDLDSLYGDELVTSPLDRALTRAMRSTRFPGKMRIAFPEVTGAPGAEKIVSKPTDGAADLLRLGEVLGKDVPHEVLENLDPKLKRIFFDETGDTPNLHRAVIGDMRNDENLFVAQFHLSLLRVHNRIVDACEDEDVRAGGSEALHAWAKTRLRHLYQWLIVNVFLKGVCDPHILQLVLSDEAAVYTRFLDDTGGPNQSGRLPLPMEFSVAAYRFGHSMVREEYDWNEFFADGDATLEHLFAFTSGGKMDDRTASRLPSIWVADWSRLASFDEENEFQATRGIDTQLSQPLSSLPHNAMRDLAILNLQKGHILNLPPAQSLITHLDPDGHYGITPLTAQEIASGGTWDAVDGTRLQTETPLWFYCLKEAEMRAASKHLGPLGSLIVASTILGLIIHDPDSYWHVGGSDAGRWHPEDMVKPSGVTVTDIKSLMQAALLM